ncbi:MAG: hypothetical protein RIT45_1410 [Pseudomonadota bacterium]
MIVATAGISSPVVVEAAKPSHPGKPGAKTYELLPTEEKATERGSGKLAWGKASGAPVFPIEAARDGSAAAALGDPKAVEVGAGGVQALAAWPAPDFNYAIDGCLDGSRTVCRNRDTHRVYWKDLWVASGSEVQVKTSDLQSVDGSIPDTLVYVLACASSSCASGTIIQIDDDHNLATSDPFDSHATFTVSNSGTIRVLVVGYDKDRHGRADIEILVDQSTVWLDADRMFGGWPLKWKEVRAGDRLWVGKDTDDSAVNGLAGYPQYHDAMLWVLGTTAHDCVSASCGRFEHVDDTIYGVATTLLPWLEIPSAFGASTMSTILVGVFGSASSDTCVASLCPVGGGSQPRWKMNARLFHQRRSDAQGGGWSFADANDYDGDGLNREIEQQLGTCDLSSDTSFWGVGVRGYDCSDYQSLIETRRSQLSTTPGGSAIPCGGSGEPPCWTPRDSDNDGLEDGTEVWVSAWSCTQVPSAPYYDGGTCSPIGLHDGPGCPDAWCTVMPLSAMTDPDPVVYDILMEQRSWVCGVLDPTGPGDTNWCSDADRHDTSAGTGGSADHSPATAQLLALEEMFSTWPYRCWDGALPTGTPPTCKDTLGDPIAADRPYLLHLHVLEGDHKLADDTTDGEVPFSGSEMSRTYMSAMLGLGAIDGLPTGPLRYGGLGRFLLMSHNDGGQAPGTTDLFEPGREERVAQLAARFAVAGNALPNATGATGATARIRSAAAHELGHTMGLVHPHDDGHPWTNASNPAEDYCATCGGGPVPYCSSFACSDTGWVNPLQSSVMSYYYFRSLPLGSAAPTYSATGAQSPDTLCGANNAHFSKGLGAAIDEGTAADVVALLPSSPARWQQEQTTIDATCYNAPWDNPCGNSSANWSAFAWDLSSGPTRARDQAPFCNDLGCFVNWRDIIATTPTTSNYSVNLSWSDLRGASSTGPVCREDELQPYDEYELMMVLGKRSLRPHGDPGATLDRDFAVYLDGFNAIELSNIAGWPVTSVAGVPDFRSDQLPVNGCTEASEQTDCATALGVQECLTDVCTSNADCRSGVCVGGTCACLSDGACWSGRCHAPTGLCSTTLGTCQCAFGSSACLGTNSVCVSIAGMTDHCNLSETSMDSNLSQNADFRGQYRHLAFGYGASAEAIRLTVPALATLTDSYHNSFRVFVDVRVDSFPAGQSTSKILFTDAFELSATSVAGGYRLAVNTSNGLSVSDSTATLHLGRWYRVVFGYKNASNVGLFLATQAWDLSGGRFLLNVSGNPVWGCRRRTTSLQPLTSGGTKLELGGEKDAPATRMRGAIDNLAIYNFVGDPAKYATPLDLATCLEVP